jgi:hypothetical protein
MSEIANAVNAALDHMTTTGKIETLIAEQIETTVKKVIRDCMEQYSAFGKRLTKAIEDGLQVDLDRLQLVGYHEFILNYIRRQLDAQLLDQAKVMIDERLTELLQPPPKSINLSKVVAEFIEVHSERWVRQDHDSITLIVEKTDYGYAHVYLDAESGKDKYKCKYQISVDANNKVYSLKIDDSDPRRQLFIGPLFQIERTLFALYASGGQLILDKEVDDIDTDYPPRECEC